MAFLPGVGGQGAGDLPRSPGEPRLGRADRRAPLGDHGPRARSPSSAPCSWPWCSTTCAAPLLPRREPGRLHAPRASARAPSSASLGGIFHMLNNAIYKACLFLGAGVGGERGGDDRLSGSSAGSAQGHAGDLRLHARRRALDLRHPAAQRVRLQVARVPGLRGRRPAPSSSSPRCSARALTLASFVKVLHSVFWGAPPAAHGGRARGSGGMAMPLADGRPRRPLRAARRLRAGGRRRPARPRRRARAGRARAGSAVLDGSPARSPGSAARPPPDARPPGTFRPLALTGLLAPRLLAALLVALPRARARPGGSAPCSWAASPSTRT